MKYTVDGTVAPTAPASGTVIVEWVEAVTEVKADGTHCYSGSEAIDCADPADAPASGTVIVKWVEAVTEVKADGIHCYSGSEAIDCAAAEWYITISNKYADMFKIGMKEDGAQVRVARQKD